MTSRLPPTTAQTISERAPIAMHHVADTAEVAHRLLELAARTSRTTQLHPDDERYLAIADAVQIAADAAHHAATLVVEAAARRG